MNNLSPSALRLWSILKKELIQIKRDYVTYALMIALPFLQVVMFGYVINTDAKNLPTIVISKDYGSFSNNLIKAFSNSGSFLVQDVTQDEKKAETLMKMGKVQFIINIPANFSEDLIKQKKPKLFIEGDASDPVILANAFNSALVIANNSINKDAHGALHYLSSKNPNFELETLSKYNSAALAQYHTLPGLLATVLTAVLVMLTSVSITSEFERGTMEMLLITPINPLEVIIGKIIPYIILGYIIFFSSLGLSYFLFKVPFHGSLLLLSIISIPYFIANLSIGIAVSIIAKIQMRAIYVANAYILPAILLSGFLFPFGAMPNWAQVIGNLMPPAHYIRISSNIMLKGSGFMEIWSDLLSIVIFMSVLVFISVKFYRKTLD